MKLALGTVQFGLPYGIANQSGQVSREDAVAIIANARLGGIDTLDTAITYGESEICLGSVGVHGFKVITKLPTIPDNIQDVECWVSDQIHASLKRLNVASVYGILLHRSDQLFGTKGAALIRSLKRLKYSGLVEKVGVSIYSPSELNRVIDVLLIDIVQAPFNLIDQRLYTSGWLQKLYDLGVEIHARSAFLQGLLLMQPQAIPEKFKYWESLWDAWHDWLRVNRISAVEACVAFQQSFPQITKVVVGVDNLEQLEQLIMVANIDFQNEWPLISSDDENLINPSRWDNL